jgi:hypothetical protein
MNRIRCDIDVQMDQNGEGGSYIAPLFCALNNLK